MYFYCDGISGRLAGGGKGLLSDGDLPRDPQITWLISSRFWCWKKDGAVVLIVCVIIDVYVCVWVWVKSYVADETWENLKVECVPATIKEKIDQPPYIWVQAKITRKLSHSYGILLTLCCMKNIHIQKSL